MSLGKILLISEEFLKNILSYFNYLAAQFCFMLYLDGYVFDV